MSIGLAISQIAKYTYAMQSITAQLEPLEMKMLATVNKQDKAFADLQMQVTRLKTLLGLVKDLLEFWKDMIKQFLAVIRSINELAHSAR